MGGVFIAQITIEEVKNTRDDKNGEDGPEPDSTEEKLDTPDIPDIPGIKIIQEIRTGGEAKIFLADQDGQEVILKLYHKGKEPSQKILETICLFSRESPEHVAQIYKYGIEKKNQQWYEIIEYIKKGSLEDYLIENKSFEESFILDSIPEINTAIHDLHSKQILHLDLKPSNILIRKTTPTLDLVLTDFGISEILSNETDLAISKRRGTPEYMAPEQVIENGIVTVKTDYWAFGMTLLYMITGNNPYSGFNKEVISSMLTTNPIPIPENIDERLNNLLKGLLCRSVPSRWGYDECEQWIGGNDSIPICPDLQLVCKFDGKKLSPRELADAFISNPESWKKAQAYVNNYLIKCLENTNNHEIAASVLHNIGSEENVNAKVILAAISLNNSIPFCYRGYKISISNLIQLLKKYVRKESTEDEDSIVTDFVNGELKRIYYKFEYLAKNIDEQENKIFKKILQTSSSSDKESNGPDIEELSYIISYAEGILKLYSRDIEIKNISKFYIACKKFDDNESIDLLLSILEVIIPGRDNMTSEDLYLIGMFYEEIGREKNAGDCFKKAVQKDKHNCSAFSKYIIYYRKYNQDIEYLKKIIRKFRQCCPGDSFSIVLEGDLNLGLKKYPEAIQAYYLAINEDPDNAEAYAGKGDVMLQINERARAKDLYEKALKIDGNCKRAQLGLKKII